MSRPGEDERWEERFQDMQRSLEAYLEEQAKLLRRGAPSQGGVAVASEGVGWRRWRPEIYLGVSLATSLLLFGLLWWRLPSPGDGPADGEVAAEEAAGAATASASSPPAAAPVAAPADPAASSPPAAVDDPAAAWDAFLADRARAAGWLRAVAGAAELPAAAVSDVQKANFTTWAGTVAGDGTLTAEHRGYTRTGLFEYVLRREGAAGDGKVDLNVDAEEYPAESLAGVLAELGLARWFARPDPTDTALQTAVVLAWTGDRDPPAL